jgi:hypothetical protein
MSYTSAKSRPRYTFDADLEMRDSYAATSSAAAQVDSAARVIDLGTGFWAGDLVVDVTAAAVDGGDEAYTIQVQLSDNSDFSTGSEYEGAALRIGDAAVTGGDVDTTTGRYVIPFHNRVVDGTCLRYARVYTTHVGSTSSITFTAFAAKHQN